MRFLFISVLFLLNNFPAFTQESANARQPDEKNIKEQKNLILPEKMSAMPIPAKPEIDGFGDEAGWSSLPMLFTGNFTQVSPQNLEPSSYTTSIKMGYTDYALYVLAYMHDPAPTTIAKELGLRDDFSRLADRFGIVLDTYNQGQNAFYFAVTAAGVQLDLYMTPTKQDVSWDAVWNSAVQITDDGWVAELEIPWSAIRFAKRPEQEWGLNFIRMVRSQNDESFWSPVDASVNGLVNQSGTLSGIQNIAPPLRLQLFPYVSTVTGYDRGSNTGSSSMGGGMDLKWGISESFTLDMALIPDFSQVQSDNQVLNLSPFEVQFAENRAFFTEGTDLFNKRGLFYSRRVGHVFYTFDPELPESASVISRPSSTKLINATKISGRTHIGLGVGLFNALTNAAYLEVQDTLRSEDQPDYALASRQVMVDPKTNFNVAVIDQNLPNNSNVTLINTNVTRMNGGRDANVTGLEFRLRDKNNLYQLTGFGALSYVWDNAESSTGYRQLNRGHRHSLSFGRISGNFQYSLSQNVESDGYEINDMGILQAPNKFNHSLRLGYQVFTPFWIFNQTGFNFNASYNRLYKPSAFTSFNGGVNAWMQFKNFWFLSFGHNRKPFGSHDYFEPRQLDKGYYFTRLPDNYAWISVRSDQRRRFAITTELWRFARKAWNAHDWGFWLAPRYRINNSVSVNTALNYKYTKNERGYATTLSREEAGQPLLHEIVFGVRNIQIVEPSARLNVTFNNKMGLNVRMRYYWTRVRYDQQFLALQRDGSLQPSDYRANSNGEGLTDHDANFNSFNIDLFYSWQIAPGSFLTFAWKDAALHSSGNARPDFAENLRNFRSQPHNHTFSLKLTYFLDYLMVRNWMQ